jgi:hypothetical protein
MQNVTNFINLLGENYYLDFIIQPYAEEVDYEKHFVLVHYQDKKYYEQTHEYIQVRQNEIINDIKSLFQKSISDIYLEVSKRKNDEIEKFLNFNIEAVKVKLNMLKNDFYIENDKSRYCAILYDDADTQTLETFFSKRDYSNTTINIEIKSIIQKLYSDNGKNVLPINESDFFLEFHIQRFKLLSILPFKLFQIGNRFINELNKIKFLNSSIPKVSQIENTNETYFQSFIKLLNNHMILQKSTVIGVMEDFKRFSQEIKSEVLIDIQNKGDNRNDYLDYLINEIEKQDYVKEADIKYVQKWLDQYNIKIEAIFTMKFYGNQIADYIDQHFMDMDNSSNKADKALIIQLDFLNFFCNYYADELITFFKSKKTITEKHSIETEITTVNQLSVNQAIILLDKLGVFTDKTFENVPNTKKAKLISQLIGKNDKNIKTAIEKLELKPKDITNGYQKDLDKIQKLLDNLE